MVVFLVVRGRGWGWGWGLGRVVFVVILMMVFVVSSWEGRGMCSVRVDGGKRVRVRRWRGRVKRCESILGLSMSLSTDFSFVFLEKYRDR